MKLELSEWTKDLTMSIATTLGEFRNQSDDEMEIFAVDCHPWNGVISLAFLTHNELFESPFLSEAAEMAAWKYYDFGSSLDSWRLASSIGSRMREAYEKAGGNRAKVAEEFYRACARCVAATLVQNVLNKYKRTRNFRISITHPDTGMEFYPPK